MTDGRSFPAPLMLALASPIPLFFIVFAVPKEAVIPVYLLAIAIELVAVPIAIFKLVRGGFLTPLNVILTLIGVVPLGFVAVVAWTLKFGHFHI